MKVMLKTSLVALPLLTSPAWSFALQPIMLDSAQMDRVTAGAAPIFERMANLLAATPAAAGSPGWRDLLPLNMAPLSALQLELMAQLSAAEPITFRQSNNGELVATQQLQSGEHLTVVKSTGGVATYRLNDGDTVTTRLLNPGETVRIEQTGTSGTINYMYLHSTGNAIVATYQKSGL